MSLSIVTFVSEPIIKEFPFKELLLSAIPIADEIVIISGEKGAHTSFGNQGIAQIIDEIANEGNDTTKMNLFFNPWEPRMRRNMMVLQKSIAISHATCDYVLALDGDEVLHEKDYDKINRAMLLGQDAYSFRVKHFYKDYKHIKSVRSDDQWYERRPYLFKNGLGIFDGYRYIESEGKCRYTSDLTTWDYEPVVAIPTSIEVFHYSFVRSKEAMLDKTNAIEKRHHPNWKDLESWSWDMSNTEEFKGTHPKSMEDRISGTK